MGKHLPIPTQLSPEAPSRTLEEFVAAHDWVTLTEGAFTFTVTFPNFPRRPVGFRYDAESGNLTAKGQLLNEFGVWFSSLDELSHYLTQRKMLVDLCEKYPPSVIFYLVDGHHEHYFSLTLPSGSWTCMRLQSDGILVPIKEFGHLELAEMKKDRYTAAEVMGMAAELVRASLNETITSTRDAVELMWNIDFALSNSM